jgi:hypothetical protein
MVKQSATWRYFFWLLMTFNIFHAGGYFLFSGIGNIGGDCVMVVAGWQPAWAWRVSLGCAGSCCLFCFGCFARDDTSNCTTIVNLQSFTPPLHP